MLREFSQHCKCVNHLSFHIAKPEHGEMRLIVTANHRIIYYLAILVFLRNVSFDKESVLYSLNGDERFLLNDFHGTPTRMILVKHAVAPDQLRDGIPGIKSVIAV